MSPTADGAAGAMEAPERPSAPVSRVFPVVLAGPSGSGKTTVGQALVRRGADVRFSISATTRPRRPEERDGEDYRFLDREEFEALVEAEEFLEWAEVHGELYGTPRSALERAREDGVHLLLDIDVQGARSVRRAAPEAVLIFLMPPDGRRIIRRLRERGSESDVELRRRMEAAETELAAVKEFDYAVINDELDQTVHAVESILRAEEHRIERMGESVEGRARTLVDEIHEALDAV